MPHGLVGTASDPCKPIHGERIPEGKVPPVLLYPVTSASIRRGFLRYNSTTLPITLGHLFLYRSMS